MLSKRYRNQLTRATFHGILDKLSCVEPYPCGFHAILEASKQLDELAVMFGAWGLHDVAMRVHQKLCSHFVECIPDGATEKSMACEAARYLCSAEQTLKGFHDEHTTRPDQRDCGPNQNVSE